MKNIEKFLLKIFIFYNFENLFILHGQDFVMLSYHAGICMDERGAA